jgi:predicted metal-dependent hydrolase
MLEVARSRSRARKLKARPLHLKIDARTPRYWMADDPFETHLLNALSLVFPAGERFFMRSVRAFRDRAEDPALIEQVRGFLAQESLHSREHTSLNDWLEELGLPAKAVEQHVEERIARRSARRGALNDLAVTCALEHLTAVLAKTLLTNPELQARFHERVLPLWIWHAIEELDHKAVAFDIYRAAGGGYARRVLGMLAATIGLLSGTVIIQAELMAADRQPRRVADYVKGAKTYFGPGGLVTAALSDYVRYYRRDFHPWEEDDQPLIERAERQLAGLLERWS